MYIVPYHQNLSGKSNRCARPKLPTAPPLSALCNQLLELFSPQNVPPQLQNKRYHYLRSRKSRKRKTIRNGYNKSLQLLILLLLPLLLLRNRKNRPPFPLLTTRNKKSRTRYGGGGTWF